MINHMKYKLSWFHLNFTIFYYSYTCMNLFTIIQQRRGCEETYKQFIFALMYVMKIKMNVYQDNRVTKHSPCYVIFYAAFLATSTHLHTKCVWETHIKSTHVINKCESLLLWRKLSDEMSWIPECAVGGNFCVCFLILRCVPSFTLESHLKT